MNSYRDLMVWQKAMQLSKNVYKLCKLLPREETYALSDQLRRAVVSIPSNIAEGFGRKSKKDYVHFLDIARGSAYEVETQLLLSVELEFYNQSQIDESLALISEISRMLSAMISKYSS